MHISVPDNSRISVIKPAPPRNTLIPKDMPEVDMDEFNQCPDCGTPVLSDCLHHCTKRSILTPPERKAVHGIPTRLGWSCHLCGASNSPDLKQCPCKMGEAA